MDLQLVKTNYDEFAEGLGKVDTGVVLAKALAQDVLSLLKHQ